jgi:hypothetical protein
LLITCNHYQKEVQNCSPSAALELGEQPTKALRSPDPRYEIEMLDRALQRAVAPTPYV